MHQIDERQEFCITNAIVNACRGRERREGRGWERREGRGWERREDRGWERREGRGWERREGRGWERREKPHFDVKIYTWFLVLLTS